MFVDAMSSTPAFTGSTPVPPQKALSFPATLPSFPITTLRASASKPRSHLSRRSLLHALSALALAPALPALAGIQTTMSDGGYADPSDAASLRAKAAGAEVDMPTFRAMLLKGEIARVWFFGVVNDTCFFEDKAGNVMKIGAGYPVEKSGSPESPLWVMAQVRDHNVPFTMSPIDSKVRVDDYGRLEVTLFYVAACPRIVFVTNRGVF